MAASRTASWALLSCSSCWNAIDCFSVVCTVLLEQNRTARLNKLCGKPPQYPDPLQVDNIFVFIRHVAALFLHVGYLIHQQQELTFDLLTLKVVFESRVRWTTCVPILVFIGLCWWWWWWWWCMTAWTERMSVGQEYYIFVITQSPLLLTLSTKSNQLPYYKVPGECFWTSH